MTTKKHATKATEKKQVTKAAEWIDPVSVFLVDENRRWISRKPGQVGIISFIEGVVNLRRQAVSIDWSFFNRDWFGSKKKRGEK